MKLRKDEGGFSLIELLIVVVIVGIIAAIAVPAYQKGKRAAENGSTFATLRVIGSTQAMFYTQNNRFGTLPELQKMLNNSLGTTVDDKVFRGMYRFEMPPGTTEDDLKKGYEISATLSLTNEAVYRYVITQTGRIVQTDPVGAPVN